MVAKKIIWQGTHVRLIKEEGSTAWVGRGQQGYFPVEYILQGPAYSHVPNRHGRDTSGIMSGTGPDMLHHKGRASKAQLAEFIEWGKVLDALWPSLEVEAGRVAAAKQAGERERERLQALENIERAKEKRGRDAWRALYDALDRLFTQTSEGNAPCGEDTRKVVRQALALAVEKKP